jgi:hypothetical protein
MSKSRRIIGREFKEERGHEKYVLHLGGYLDGKRPAGRHRRRWEDNSKTSIRDIGLEGVDWIHVAQDRD